MQLPTSQSLGSGHIWDPKLGQVPASQIGDVFGMRAAAKIGKCSCPHPEFGIIPNLGLSQTWAAVDFPLCPAANRYFDSCTKFRAFRQLLEMGHLFGQLLESDTYLGSCSKVAAVWAAAQNWQLSMKFCTLHARELSPVFPYAFGGHVTRNFSRDSGRDSCVSKKAPNHNTTWNTCQKAHETSTDARSCPISEPSKQERTTFRAFSVGLILVFNATSCISYGKNMDSRTSANRRGEI